MKIQFGKISVFTGPNHVDKGMAFRAKHCPEAPLITNQAVRDMKPKYNLPPVSYVPHGRHLNPVLRLLKAYNKAIAAGLMDTAQQLATELFFYARARAPRNHLTDKQR